MAAEITYVKVVGDKRRSELKREAERLLRELGFKLDGNPQLIIVLGGDGLFSYCARLYDRPLLFVGLKGKEPAASRAFLAQIDYYALEGALKQIKQGSYELVSYPRLAASLNGTLKGTSLTDVYLERGAEAGCLRLQVEVEGPRSFTEFAIANGIIVTTPLGASGYYSYVDKIKGDLLNVDAVTTLAPNDLGVCYILPTYTLRRGSDLHPLRYSIANTSKVSVRLLREGDARLYGVGKALRGYRVRLGDVVSISLHDKPAKLIKLQLNSSRRP